ncbi:hypothetical protein Bpfe_002366 [Biomphalaria pfeifferi]|uniref:Uncharacterized protein n=1 Tax=Biomphalaria pfeifferi TaxID=112525 RepID=A0AAD8C8J9_BIOPF|nr:hypothetical protein Bpfe_002364 [Biomphalaria pfeifferi]KAK0068431.1 hypothetical protein Bpfe_002366 [Biomphalaria pfeifferi]
MVNTPEKKVETLQRLRVRSSIADGEHAKRKKLETLQRLRMRSSIADGEHTRNKGGNTAEAEDEIFYSRW